MFLLKKLKIISFILAALLIASFAVRNYNIRHNRMEERKRFMMDTFVMIKAAGPSKKAIKAIEDALDRMQEIDVKMNPMNPASPLYAFNEKGTPIDDPEIVLLVQKGLEISKLSGGAFDMTLLPLTKLWGFSGKAPHLPADRDIQDALAKTGYKYLVVKDGKVKKLRPYIQIDFGGIAKGYAVGEAVKILKREGITSAMIDAGGDIFAVGKSGGKKLWKIGVKSPRDEGIVGYVELTEKSIACSGDYERYFIKDGKRYHHIFNAKTGYPTDGGLLSASIIYHDCTMTDVWTKVLFVLGPEKGMELVKKNPGMEAIMVTKDNKVLYFGTENMLKKI